MEREGDVGKDEGDVWRVRVMCGGEGDVRRGRVMCGGGG